MYVCNFFVLPKQVPLVNEILDLNETTCIAKVLIRKNKHVAILQE